MVDLLPVETPVAIADDIAEKASKAHADSEALSRQALGLRVGAPLWTVGWDRHTPSRSEPINVARDQVLHLSTGLLDERRRILDPSSSDPKIASAHPKFLYCLRYQDTWTAAQHHDWWSWALDDWPISPSPRHADALAFGIAYSVERMATARREIGIANGEISYLFDVDEADEQTPTPWSERARREAQSDLESFCGRLGNRVNTLSVSGLKRTHTDLDDLVNRGVLRTALAMLLAPRTNQRPGGVLLPRVAVAPHAYLPTASQFAAYAESSTAHEASAEIVRSSILVVAEMEKELAGVGHRPTAAVAGCCVSELDEHGRLPGSF